MSVIGGNIATLEACKWIRAHANPIDIGNDTARIEAVFNAIWHLI